MRALSRRSNVWPDRDAMIKPIIVIIPANIEIINLIQLYQPCFLQNTGAILTATRSTVNREGLYYARLKEALPPTHEQHDRDPYRPI